MEDLVSRMISEKPVVIFSKSSWMSHTVEKLLGGFGVNPTVHVLDAIQKGKELEQALVRRGYSPADPAVFIGGQFVGGTNKVMSLHLEGSLIPMLKHAGAIWL